MLTSITGFNTVFADVIITIEDWESYHEPDTSGIGTYGTWETEWKANIAEIRYQEYRYSGDYSLYLSQTDGDDATPTSPHILYYNLTSEFGYISNFSLFHAMNWFQSTGSLYCDIDFIHDDATVISLRLFEDDAGFDVKYLDATETWNDIITASASRVSYDNAWINFSHVSDNIMNYTYWDSTYGLSYSVDTCFSNGTGAFYSTFDRIELKMYGDVGYYGNSKIYIDDLIFGLEEAPPPTSFRWDIIPDKDTYYVLDTVTLRLTTYEANPYWSRIVNATDVFVFFPNFQWTIGVKDTVFTIPLGYGNGTWTIETYVTDSMFYPPEWGVDEHYDDTFTVAPITGNYYIQSSKYYLQIPDSIDITFSAFEGESYILQLIHARLGIISNITIPTVGATQDYVYSNAFTLTTTGTYYVKLINGSDNASLAITSGIRASDYAEFPTYTTNLQPEYVVDKEYTVIIYSDSIKQYKYIFYSPYNVIIKTGLYSGARGHPVKITFNVVLEGYYLYVFDADGTQNDVNTYYKQFNVIEPPLISDEYMKAMFGAFITLGFLLLPLVISMKSRSGVSNVVYAVFGGIGLGVSTIAGFFPLWLPLMITILMVTIMIIEYKKGQ